MKKNSLVIVAMVFFVCLLTYPVYGVDFKIHGSFDNRYEVTNNAEAIADYTSGSKTNVFSIYSGDDAGYAPFVPGVGFLGNTNDDSGDKKGEDENNDHFWGEAKYRMRFEFTTDDNMAKGVWAMEVGFLRYGEPQGPNGAGRSKGGTLSGDGVNTETRFLYVDFQNPLVSHTSRLRLGLQPITLNEWLWTETAMGVKYFGSTNLFDYRVAWVRGEENFTNENEDDDAFFAKVTYKPKWEDLSLRLGLFFCYYTQGNESDTLYHLTDMSNTNPASIASIDVNYDEDDYYVGLDGGLDWKSFFARWDFIYQWGTVDFDQKVVENGTDDELDRSAYFLHLDAGYYWTPKLKTTFTWWYASGDDDPNDGDADNYDNIDTDVLGDAVIFEEQVTDDLQWTDAPYLLDKGFIMFRIKADYQATPNWSIGPAFNYMLLAEDTYNGDDDVGFEIALYSQYKIWKGLNFNFAAGYLFAGDALDAWASDANSANGYEGDADDMWRVTAGVRFRF